MQINNELSAALAELTAAVGKDKLENSSYIKICELMRISKLSYDIDLGEEFKYRDNRAIVFPDDDIKEGNRIVLYNDGQQTGLCLTYTYYRDDREYVHAFMEFKIGIRKEDLDLDVIEFFSDILFIIVSRRNIRRMLDVSESSDALTGIPNVVYLTKRYKEVSQKIPPEDLLVLRLNLQNFKYINDAAGARAGDEAIIQYSHKLCTFVGEDEGVCRLGGDNFVVFLHKDKFDDFLQKVKSVEISNLKSAPGRSYTVTTWTGVSRLEPGQRRTFVERLNEASAACDLGRGKLKRPVVYYNEELVEAISHNRNIIAMFRPAIQKREFIPFFQAKVDMRTGKLVGFESLCRWMHEGRFIFPDQFIPILDKNSLIPELDITIFKETCSAIRQWKNMGLEPPVISSNFSKKNLFVPDIEDKIADIIDDYNLSPDGLEIEITESVKETEYEQLMHFVKGLKMRGLRISVDDFGTGYSSLSLIHNIDADTIKIDKSFVDMLPEDRKSGVLIESIINIASRLNMSVIAEGVETVEQGKALMEMGCNNAQGYYYSKPVDFDEATRLIENPPFAPMA